MGQALEENPGHLKVYQGRNEQGMAHAAIAFAKQKHRRQIMACTSSVGPGAANMVTAAATATANRIPVLFLPGDTFATRQPDPVLQQMEHQHDLTITTNDAFRAVSKYWDRIQRPEQLMTAMINAMRVLTDPADTGAVTIAFLKMYREKFMIFLLISSRSGFIASNADIPQLRLYKMRSD